MEQKHRQCIDRLCNLIVKYVNMKTLLPYLFINGIYNYDDCNMPTWTQNLKTPEIIKDIILTIKTRGPEAFYKLIESLRQSDQNLLADILEHAN